MKKRALVSTILVFIFVASLLLSSCSFVLPGIGDQGNSGGVEIPDNKPEDDNTNEGGNEDNNDNTDDNTGTEGGNDNTDDNTGNEGGDDSGNGGENNKVELPDD